MKTVQEVVAERIAGAGPKVFDTVVDIMAGEEINRRVDIIKAAISRKDSMKKDLDKASRPDQITVDSSGGRVEMFSAKAYEAKEKLSNDYKKLVDLIDKCLNENTKDDYDKLTKLTSGGGGKEQGQ